MRLRCSLSECFRVGVWQGEAQKFCSILPLPKIAFGSLKESSFFVFSEFPSISIWNSVRCPFVTGESCIANGFGGGGEGKGGKALKSTALKTGKWMAHEGPIENLAAQHPLSLRIRAQFLIHLPLSLLPPTPSPWATHVFNLRHGRKPVYPLFCILQVLL